MQTTVLIVQGCLIILMVILHLRETLIPIKHTYVIKNLKQGDRILIREQPNKENMKVAKVFFNAERAKKVYLKFDGGQPYPVDYDSYHFHGILDD